MNFARIWLAAAAIGVTASTMAQNIQWNQVGSGTQTNSNSGYTTYQQFGNTTYGSDGSRSQQWGNQNFNSNGTSSYDAGNVRIHSNGTSSYTTGDISRDSNGRICQRIGEQVICR